MPGPKPNTKLDFDVFRFKEYNRLSYREIAHMLGVDPRMILRRYRRAQKTYAGYKFAEAAPKMAVDRQELQKGLVLLQPREKEILIHRFGLNDSPPKTLKNVGHIFGVTRERIRQIEVRALKKIRDVDKSVVLNS